MNSNAASQAWAIARHSYLSSWRVLNSTLDVVFYDVASLSPQEKSRLSAHTNPEGSVLIVPPRSAGEQIEALMPGDFVRERSNGKGHAVDAIVVAGVGSSAVGTAALARNVADYLHRPVAGIVSGFGISDVISEALGGWFVLGANNTLRDIFARMFDAYELKDHVRDPESHQDIKEHFESAGIDKDRFIYGSPDSTTLLYLLSRLGNRIKLLVGHSKGNYSIENALEGLLAACKKTGTPISSDLCIVTLGAVIRFPSEFPNVHQFIGQVDFFGMMNSRAFLRRVQVPGAWHSLNTLMPGHLPVREALQAVEVH